MSSGSLRVKVKEKLEQAEQERLGYLLKRTQHALRAKMDQLLEPLGLTAPQYNVLSAVQRSPGISNAALARGAFVTAQSMLGIVANLEHLGLITREAHPTHGRIRSSELTEKGTAASRKAHRLLSGVDETMTFGFSDKERNLLRSLLEKCAKNLSANGRAEDALR